MCIQNYKALKIEEGFRVPCCKGVGAIKLGWSVTSKANSNTKTYSVQSFGKHHGGRWQSNIETFACDHKKWAEKLRYILNNN